MKLIKNEDRDPNQKHYFKPSSFKELAENLVTFFKKDSKPMITIWEKGEAEENAEHFIFLSLQFQSGKIELLPPGNIVQKVIGSKNIGKTILVKIPLDQNINFFSTGKLEFNRENLSYTLSIEGDIFKSQKRSNERINCNQFIKAQIKLAGRVYECRDFSVGGTSIAIGAEQLNEFKIDELFPDTTLRFDKKNYFLPYAKIAGVKPAETPNQFVVGLSFHGLTEDVKDELHYKIQSEKRGQEMMSKFDHFLKAK